MPILNSFSDECGCEMKVYDFELQVQNAVRYLIIDLKYLNVSWLWLGSSAVEQGPEKSNRIL